VTEQEFSKSPALNYDTLKCGIPGFVES